MVPFGEKDNTQGINGLVECYSSTLRIILGNEHEKYSLTLPIRIIDNDEMPILLGRELFFDEFVITFNQKLNKILLKKQSK